MTVSQKLLSRRGTRRAEVLLALIVMGSHGLFWSLGSLPEWARHDVVMAMLVDGLMIVFFATPLLLGLTVVLSAAVDDIGIGSIIAVGVALLTMYIVGISVYALVYPPEGGGVYFGHILSSITAVPFAIVVLFRRVLNRIFSRLWIHPGGIFSHSD